TARDDNISTVPQILKTEIAHYSPVFVQIRNLVDEECNDVGRTYYQSTDYHTHL
ncbi:hypothetical protein BT69DRAFT_1279162, partial [Atractiella rhizophila]